jgi:hypothetical protein
VCSSQTSPIAAPHVMQGTDNICFGVSSFDFISTSCDALSLEKCPILLILSKLDRAECHSGYASDFLRCEQKRTSLVIVI